LTLSLSGDNISLKGKKVSMKKAAVQEFDEGDSPVKEREQTALSERNAWEELYRIGEEIGRGWSSSQSAVEILAEMRR
jgi:hypothetical protein